MLRNTKEALASTTAPTPAQNPTGGSLLGGATYISELVMENRHRLDRKKGEDQEKKKKLYRNTNYLPILACYFSSKG